MTTTATVAGYNRAVGPTRIIIPGEPVPWARARRRGSRYFTAPDVVAYREIVQKAWLVAGRPRADDTDALTVDVSFYLSRPPSHYGRAGQVLETAPAEPIGKPDIDNLVKGILDPLSGLLYRDDAQVTGLSAARKMYCHLGEEPRVVLTAWVPAPRL